MTNKILNSKNQTDYKYKPKFSPAQVLRSKIWAGKKGKSQKLKLKTFKILFLLYF